MSKVQELIEQPLTVISGTTKKIAISIKDKQGNSYLLKSGDQLIFGVKQNIYNGTYLIKKTLTADDESNSKYMISLTPQDTNLSPRRYFYDVSLQSANGDFQKVIPKSIFLVKGAVTEKE